MAGVGGPDALGDQAVDRFVGGGHQGAVVLALRVAAAELRCRQLTALLSQRNGKGQVLIQRQLFHHQFTIYVQRGGP